MENQTDQQQETHGKTTSHMDNKSEKQTRITKDNDGLQPTRQPSYRISFAASL